MACSRGGVALLLCAACTSQEPKPIAVPETQLASIGPRVVSNASDYPVMIWGEHLSKGTVLRIKTDPPLEVPTHFVDSSHLTAIFPRVPISPERSTAHVTAELVNEQGRAYTGSARVTVINDAQYFTPYAMGLAEGAAWVVNRNQDEVRIVPGAAKIDVCDRPRAIERWRESFVIACESKALMIVSTATTAAKKIALPADAAELAIDGAKNLAYVSSHARDRVLIVELESGRVTGELPAGVNPSALALAENRTLLIAANYQSQDVSIIDLAKKTETRLRPGPHTPIVGGHTEKLSEYIMGSTPPRAVVYSEKQHLAFVATLGPTLGPNPDRVEVSQNGGISVVDARAPKWVRHVSMLSGVPDSLALDDERGVLYAADSATGRVVAFDTKKLAESDLAARDAILAAIDLPVPGGVPLIRPEGDFGKNKRSRIALHFGPKVIRLSKDRAYVLSRFSGAVQAIDVKNVKKKKLALGEMWRAYPVPAEQVERRRGEVIYFTDLGDTRMTCDTCHPEGNNGGIMFTKGRPMRIYRAPTCLAIRESPPYFTPSRLPSIKRTIHDVLARNRFENPVPTEEEATAATELVGTLVGRPNPYGSDGTLPPEVELPDATRGKPAQGLTLFETKAGCAKNECHPPPHFTADQDPATRGALYKLGTPLALPLRPEMQDIQTDFGVPPPSLMGLWDQFPLFLSGAAGNEVQADGTVAATKPFAMRWVLENPAWAAHVGELKLTAEERNDLLAYLMTL